MIVCPGILSDLLCWSEPLFSDSLYLVQWRSDGLLCASFSWVAFPSCEPRLREHIRQSLLLKCYHQFGIPLASVHETRVVFQLNVVEQSAAFPREYNLRAESPPSGRVGVQESYLADWRYRWKEPWKDQSGHLNSDPKNPYSARDPILPTMQRRGLHESYCRSYPLRQASRQGLNFYKLLELGQTSQAGLRYRFCGVPWFRLHLSSHQQRSGKIRDSGYGQWTGRLKFYRHREGQPIEWWYLRDSHSSFQLRSVQEFDPLRPLVRSDLPAEFPPPVRYLHYPQLFCPKEGQSANPDMLS